jgi:hypothetical protein
MYRKMKNCSNCICSFAVNKLKIRGFFVVGFSSMKFGYWGFDEVTRMNGVENVKDRNGKSYPFILVFVGESFRDFR